MKVDPMRTSCASVSSKIHNKFWIGMVLFLYMLALNWLNWGGVVNLSLFTIWILEVKTHKILFYQIFHTIWNSGRLFWVGQLSHSRWTSEVDKPDDWVCISHEWILTVKFGLLSMHSSQLTLLQRDLAPNSGNHTEITFSVYISLSWQKLVRVRWYDSRPPENIEFSIALKLILKYEYFLKT